jgi:predicted HTH transcriptional regulator
MRAVPAIRYQTFAICAPQANRVWNFPYGAVVEATGNAVQHSYEEWEPLEARIDRQELVVLSFPGPVRSIRLEDLQAGRAVSRRYRNRRVGEFLKKLDLTEGRSTGIPKNLKVIASNGSPPLFESDPDRLSFVIYLAVHPQARSGQLKSCRKSDGKSHASSTLCRRRCLDINFRQPWHFEVRSNFVRPAGSPR